MKKTSLALLLMLTALPCPAMADVVDDAYAICAVMENTGHTTGCEVKGWGKTVDVRIDTSSAEAREICLGVAESTSQNTTNFHSKGWKLRILSPYSGDQPIAICDLH